MLCVVKKTNIMLMCRGCHVQAIHFLLLLLLWLPGLEYLIHPKGLNFKKYVDQLKKKSTGTGNIKDLKSTL